MSHAKKVIIPVVAALVVSGALALAWTARDNETQLPSEAGDLAQVAAIEITDAGGQVVLSGRFGAEQADDDGDRERKADLRPASGAAKGEAEIEVSSSNGGTVKQELEVEVEGLPAGAAFTVRVDGRAVVTLTTDERGRAKTELSTHPK
jgi:hypothetical protein